MNNEQEPVGYIIIKPHPCTKGSAETAFWDEINSIANDGAYLTASGCLVLRANGLTTYVPENGAQAIITKEKPAQQPGQQAPENAGTVPMECFKIMADIVREAVSGRQNTTPST